MIIKYAVALSIILIFAFVSIGFAQSGIGTIDGRITQYSQALPDVNITLMGTSMGASADGDGDGDGNYKISEVPAGIYNLRASYVGYKK